VKIDAKTRNATVYPTPTRTPRPRRVASTTKADCGLPNIRANAIGVFDPKTERHHGVEGADALERAL